MFAIALALEGIGSALISAGQPASGAELVAAGLTMRERAGTPLPPGERADTDVALKAAAHQLPAGGELDLESAVAHAIAALN